MANPEHLAILKNGVVVWNKWLSQNSDALIKAGHYGADLSGADLRHMDLRGVDFTATNLSNVDLSGSSLGRANFRFALRPSGAPYFGLMPANPSNADLSRVSYFSLVPANLSNADLSGVNLSYALLTRAILSGAKLSGAVLRWANFHGTDLSESDFSRASLLDTVFADVNLSTTKCLHTVEHLGPSPISIESIDQSGGNIPDVFLRGAGVPDSLISYSHSLIGQANRYHSCFISSQEADDLFSEKLYNDLQGAGVRCWRWKEDANWGKALLGSIDEAVRIYDKLIVICSENSLNAQPVIREIERALQKEDDIAKAGKEPEVLFPIRLDDYIFSGWNHYRKADVTLKNVGDFRNWQDPQQYRKAFDRLVRDLKA